MCRFCTSAYLIQKIAQLINKLSLNFSHNPLSPPTRNPHNDAVVFVSAAPLFPSTSIRRSRSRSCVASRTYSTLNGNVAGRHGWRPALWRSPWSSCQAVYDGGGQAPKQSACLLAHTHTLHPIQMILLCCCDNRYPRPGYALPRVGNKLANESRFIIP